MGRPIEEPVVESTDVSTVEAVESVITEETDTKISTSVVTNELYEVDEETREEIEAVFNANRTQAIVDGVLCAAEMILLIRVGLGVDKDVESMVTDPNGNQYKLTFEKCTT